MLNDLCHIQQLLWLYGGLMKHVYICMYVSIYVYSICTTFSRT